MIKIIKPEQKDMLDMVIVIYRAWLQTHANKKAGITRSDIRHYFKKDFTPEGLLKRWEKMQNNPENKVFVAIEDDVLVGMMIIVEHANDNQLKAIQIMPEYQGKGIGSLLWKKALEELNNKKKWIVQCAIYNTRAIKIYEKWGFKDNGKRWNDEKRVMKSGAMIPEMELELTV